MKSLAWLLLPCVLCLVGGCRSGPPQPSKSSWHTQADQAAMEASRFSQTGRWLAAAERWNQAADHYALLNRQAQEAVARHNLAQAQRHLHQVQSAREQLEIAAAINHNLGLEAPWWRNQIALLQLELSEANTDVLAERFGKLIPRSAQISDPGLRGLFLNEQGLWELRAGRTDEALAAFKEARQLLDEAGDNAGTAAVLANEASALETRDEWQAAEQQWQSVLIRFESLGDPMGIATALAGQGRILVKQQRDLVKAEDLLRRAARNFQQLQAASALAQTNRWLEEAMRLQGKQE